LGPKALHFRFVFGPFSLPGAIFFVMEAFFAILSDPDLFLSFFHQKIVVFSSKK